MRSPLADLVDRKLEDLERAWRDGNFAALSAAMKCCRKHERTPPDWLVEGVEEVCTVRGQAGGLGRLGAREEADRQNRIHYMRWDAIKELHARKHELANIIKPTWEEAYIAAARGLRGTIAAGAPDTMKASYQIVQKAFKNGQGARRFYIVK
jgi:hypothetical protein